MDETKTSGAGGPGGILEYRGQRIEVRRGQPEPLGAMLLRGGINFALFSRHATAVTLAIFEPGATDPLFLFPLDRRQNRTGDVWHAFIAGLCSGVGYGYLLDRSPNDNPRLYPYDSARLMLDPCAHAIVGGESWGVQREERERTTRSPYGLRQGFVTDEDFDWGDDQPLNRPMSDTVIYELHVRGFTRHPSSGAARPGTYAGLTERIPYLVDLGVTAVELLPVYEFEEADTGRRNPRTGEDLLNYWGYHPINFFSPNASYAVENKNGGQVREFKAMVRAFHRAGIEVILDVVFNHTAEGDQRGPSFSFRGIDNPTYYIIDPLTGEYYNYSGCGNTFNCNHPVARELIKDCLHYWVTEMHVDGFRFDLASILGRGSDGAVLSNPPLLEQIAFDPVLANTKVIAEAWDAAGLYQVGSFPSWRRWAEWNGKFRDDLRRFVKGDPGLVGALANRLAGSPDVYRCSGRSPLHSINFITCHDGFTLRDLVAYNGKHNEQNGEDNRDGGNDNQSWNCGAEGETAGLPSAEAARIEGLRLRQQKNLAALLLLSRGVPMLLGGDELGHTQRGNNNAYCQDNELSWMDWRQRETNAGLLRFFRELIRFRQSFISFRYGSFEEPPSCECRLSFHGAEPGRPDWSYESRSLAAWLTETDGGREDIYLMANAWWEPIDFTLPELPDGRRWRLKLDTSLASPDDIAAAGKERELIDPWRYTVGPRSVVALVAG